MKKTMLASMSLFLIGCGEESPVEPVTPVNPSDQAAEERTGRGGGMMMETRMEEAGIEKPENWEALTRDERKTFLEENGITFEQKGRGEGRGLNRLGESELAPMGAQPNIAE